MQIRVEIEVTPEELRRFLGLPDVAGLGDDIIGFLRDKVGAAKVRLTGVDDDEEAPPERKRSRGRRRDSGDA